MLLAVAQGQEPATLSGAELSRSAAGDTLLCRFSGEPFLSESVQSTLLSGLPVLINLNLVIRTDGQIRLRENKRFRMSYDIWEDQYQLDGAGERYLFPDLEQLRAFWSAFNWKIVFPRQAENAEKNLGGRITAKLTLLTANQGRELRDWLFNDNQTEETSPGLMRDTGFQLDLNSLISLLWSSKNDTERSESYAANLTAKPAVKEE